MQAPVVQHIQRSVKKQLPQILSGAAVIGVVATVVLAVRATPAASEDVRKAQEDRYEPGVPLVVVEGEIAEVKSDWTLFKSAQVSWRRYIPTTICGTVTIACIIGANSINMRRMGGLLAAYALVDGDFRKYKDKVLEQVTPQKAEKIDNEITADKIKANQPSTVIVTGGGDQLCYETMTGRYFLSSAEKIRRAALDLDARIIMGSDMHASQNEFWDALGLEHCQIGEQLGWTPEYRLDVKFSSHVTADDKTALAIEYGTYPVYNYYK